MQAPRLFAAASALLLAACASDVPIAPSEPLPPLETQRWYVQRADGQQLPALVAHGQVNGMLEQLFLDSAIVDIDAEGVWTRRFWMQRFRGGEPVGGEGSQLVGTWVATADVYRFVESTGGRSFELPGSFGPLVVMNLPGVGTADRVVAELRKTPPAPGPVGAWSLSSIRDVPLPAAMYVFDDYMENGVQKSIHLIVDSASITLRANGTYRHRIDFTEWEGEPGGPPERVRFVWFANDYGSWVRQGTQLDFDSGWLQGLRMAGEFPVGGELRMWHGLSHGDEWVPVGYVRR